MKPQEIETVEQLKQYVKENPPKDNKVTVLKRNKELQEWANNEVRKQHRDLLMYGNGYPKNVVLEEIVLAKDADIFFVDGIGIFKFEE